MKESFILYTNAWPMIQKLDTEQRGRLFTAIVQHAVGEDPPEMDALTDMAFSFIAAQMDRDTAKYQNICAKRAEYGRKGGLAKASKSKQKLAKLADNENDNENDNDNENVNENENDNERREARPSLSYEELEKLYEEYGPRADELTADVASWYAAHPERVFPGWSEAVAQFDRNQKRWGHASPSKDINEIMAMAFGDKS